MVVGAARSQPARSEWRTSKLFDKPLADDPRHVSDHNWLAARNGPPARKEAEHGAPEAPVGDYTIPG